MKYKLKGQAVIEAAFIYPLVIFVIMFMIFTAVFVAQRIALEGKLQKIASIAANERTRPNSHIAFYAPGTKVYSYSVNSQAYIESYKTHHPYRLFFGNGNQVSSVVDNANLNDLKMSAFGFMGEINYREEGIFLRKRIVLSLDYSLNGMKLLRVFKLNDVLNKVSSNIVVDSPILEPTETVRTVDIAKDLWKFVYQKFEQSKAGQKLLEAMDKMKNFINRNVKKKGG